MGREFRQVGYHGISYRMRVRALQPRNTLSKGKRRAAPQPVHRYGGLTGADAGAGVYLQTRTKARRQLHGVSFLVVQRF